MAEPNDIDLATIRFFEIGVDPDHWAVYRHIVDVTVGNGRWREIVARAVEADEIPAGSPRPLPITDGEPPERWLDVDEAAERDGVQLYVFRLNAVTAGQHRLHFAATPVVELPNGLSPKQTFLERIELCPAGDDRWALFSCDVGAVRRSPIGKHAGPQDNITIPFYFNLVDPALGFAPWMIGNHSHVPPARGGQAEAAAKRMMTHGGAHPPTTHAADGGHTGAAAKHVLTHGGAHPPTGSQVVIPTENP